MYLLSYNVTNQCCLRQQISHTWFTVSFVVVVRLFLIQKDRHNIFLEKQMCQSLLVFFREIMKYTFGVLLMHIASPSNMYRDPILWNAVNTGVHGWMTSTMNKWPLFPRFIGVGLSGRNVYWRLTASWRSSRRRWKSFNSFPIVMMAGHFTKNIEGNLVRNVNDSTIGIDPFCGQWQKLGYFVWCQLWNVWRRGSSDISHDVLIYFKVSAHLDPYNYLRGNRFFFKWSESREGKEEVGEISCVDLLKMYHQRNFCWYW